MLTQDDNVAKNAKLGFCSLRPLVLDSKMSSLLSDIKKFVNQEFALAFLPKKIMVLGPMTFINFTVNVSSKIS